MGTSQDRRIRAAAAFVERGVTPHTRSLFSRYFSRFLSSARQQWNEEEGRYRTPSSTNTHRRQILFAVSKGLLNARGESNRRGLYIIDMKYERCVCNSMWWLGSYFCNSEKSSRYISLYDLSVMFSVISLCWNWCIAKVGLPLLTRWHYIIIYCTYSLLFILREYLHVRTCRVSS